MLDTNSTDNLTDDCDLARSVINQYFKGLALAECIVAPLAIPPNLLLLWAVWRVTVFPSNLRLILGYLSCVFLLFSSTAVVKGLYILLSPPCAYTFTKRNCRIFDMATSSMVIPNLYFCLASLCIERLYATVRYRSYDKNSIPWVGGILIVCSWVCMFLIYCNDVFYLPTDQYVPICDSAFFPVRSAYLMPGYLILECLTMAMTVFTFVYNRHLSRHMVINRALYDLSARFLVNQNEQINTIVLPSITLHFIAHIPIVVLLIPVNGGLVLSAPTRALLLRSTYVWRLTYALCDPLLAFYLNVHLRQNLEEGPFGRAMKYFGVNIGKTNKPPSTAAQTTVHFDYLVKTWSRKSGKVSHAPVVVSKKQAFTELKS